MNHNEINVELFIFIFYFCIMSADIPHSKVSEIPTNKTRDHQICFCPLKHQVKILHYTSKIQNIT